MSKVFDEYYGELDAEQHALYKANNVSPADHDLLVDQFGDDLEALMAYVRENSPNGNFRILWGN